MNEQQACVPYSLDVMVYCAEQRLQRLIEMSAAEHMRAIRFNFRTTNTHMKLRHVREDVLRVFAGSVLDEMAPYLKSFDGKFATGGLVSNDKRHVAKAMAFGAPFGGESTMKGTWK